MGEAPLIDAAQVSEMIAVQFPEWAGLPVEPVRSAGTDNLIFRLGDDLAVRLPGRPEAAGQAEREHRWLSGLAPRLPMAVPAPLRIGRPTAAYAWTWSICPWLPGRDATESPVLEPVCEAARLGRFLAVLHGLEARGGPSAGTANHWRGAPLKWLDARLRRDLVRLADQIDAERVSAIWDAALAAPAWSGEGVWVHGDLHAGNLLVSEGRFSAVLDFGLMAVGDPACDLPVAWSLFDGPARIAFRKAAGVDDMTWTRGRGWTVFTAVIALAFYLGKNSVLCDMSRRALAEVCEAA